MAAIEARYWREQYQAATASPAPATKAVKKK
jgi:hypothetical protein